MFLLDIDTIIYNLKGNEAIKRNLQDHFEDPMKICVITLMELYFGVYKSKKIAGNLSKVRTIENAFEIISVNSDCAEIFGMLKASLKKSGMLLDDFDLITAACAMTNNLTLVTNNTKHFRRIDGLKLTNWTVYPE